MADTPTQLDRIEALLILISGKLAVNPVEMIEAVGKAVAEAQGLTGRGDGGEVAEAPDLIVTPSITAMEPWNETFEREQPDWNDDAQNQSWWDTMTNGERPVGELDSEGP